MTERLGPYEIRSRLGAGGMGTVYLGHDARLNRDVAIKVLPEATAADPDRLARFTREAQALAALNHPNIAHVYGLEDLDGTAALVMEYVPGRTLEAMLTGGPLPAADVVAIARQIAQGFEAAHERGIVHRDLKPANVIVEPDGQVKVLDFGLAKDLAAASNADLMNSPTMLSPVMTVQGVILGTAAYMSPEQARGRIVDKRSDVWSFGVILWEMLTGRRPFGGETVTDTLAAIIGADPPWMELPADMPEALRHLLRRCLEKDPHQRLRDIGEARIALDEAAPSKTGALDPAAGRDAGRRSPSTRTTAVWRWLPWGVAALALLLAGVSTLLTSAGATDAPLMAFDMTTPAGTALRLTERPAIEITADGRTVAFTAISNDTLGLYIRRRQEPDARALPVRIGNIRQGGDIAFSPDGRNLAFTDGTSLMKVPLDGGPPVRLASVLSGTRGVAWADDRTIVFSPSPRAGLMVVDAAGGGAPRQLTDVSAALNERTHRWPAPLPGGKAILFTVGELDSPDSYDDAGIDALVLATGERKRLVTGASFARYAPGGKLIIARGPSLYAVDFDPEGLTISGAPVLVVPRVATDPNTGAAQFSVAQDGTLIYVNGAPSAGLRRLVWVDQAGAVQPIDLTPAVFNDPSIAPDGSRAAVLVGPLGQGDIWIYDFRQTTFTRLTTDGLSATPVWSADGRSVYYASIDTSTRESAVVRRNADGSGAPERLATLPLRTYIGSIAGGGTAALGAANNWIGSFNVFRIPLGSGGEAVRLTEPDVQTYAATISPNGQWMAFASEQTGRREVYVQSLAGHGRRLVSTGGGEEPHWSPDGRALYYRVDDRLMMVPIELGPSLSVGKPALLLRGLYDLQSETGQSYAVDPRSGRFLMIRLVAEANTQTSDSFRVSLNWARQLNAAR